MDSCRYNWAKSGKRGTHFSVPFNGVQLELSYIRHNFLIYKIWRWYNNWVIPVGILSPSLLFANPDELLCSIFGCKLGHIKPIIPMGHELCLMTHMAFCVWERYTTAPPFLYVPDLGGALRNCSNQQLKNPLATFLTQILKQSMNRHQNPCNTCSRTQMLRTTKMVLPSQKEHYILLPWRRQRAWCYLLGQYNGILHYSEQFSQEHWSYHSNEWKSNKKSGMDMSMVYGWFEVETTKTTRLATANNSSHPKDVCALVALHHSCYWWIMMLLRLKQSIAMTLMTLFWHDDCLPQQSISTDMYFLIVSVDIIAPMLGGY